MAAAANRSPFGPRRILSAVGLLLLLGVGARSVRYGLRFPLWEDECFLAVNLMDGAAAVSGEALRLHQVAPPLFLWAERAAVRLLGFSEPSLRLLPFLASLASLLLFDRLARLLLTGGARILAVALFAVSYPGIRYAAEGKPYGVDLVVALALLVPAAAILRGRESRRRLALLTALVPVAFGLSFPSVFVAGGIGAVLALRAARRPGERADRWLLALFAAVTVLSFAIWQSVVAPQRGAENLFMRSGWDGAFPPERLLELPRWLLEIHAGDLLAFPFGGGNYGSILTLVAVAAGGRALVRRGRGDLLLFLAAPFAFNLAAASFRRYPYGGHPKLALYLSPLVCIAAAVGLRSLLGAVRRAGHPALRPTLLAIASIALVTVGRDLVFPYKTLSDERARSFARWFYTAAAQGEEVACAKTDLGLDFSPATFRELSWSAMYLCNRRMYAPRQPFSLARVSSSRPLRCLVYRDPRYPFDEAAFAAWRRRMGERYVEIGHESFPFPRYDKLERRLLQVDTLESYRFVPREGSP